MVNFFLQAAEQVDAVPPLIEYGAIGLVASLAIGGAVYAFRRWESTTSRFISYLEERGEKDAALHTRVAETLVAVANLLARVEKELERKDR